MQEIKYVPTVIEGLETLEQDCKGFVIQMREKGTTAPVREKIAQAVKVGDKWKSEAVVFEETIDGKTYEFRGAVMGKGKLLSIFSLWTLFACGITEPTDVSYIGDAVKQNIIWSLDQVGMSVGDIASDLTISESSGTYVIKARVTYLHDNDNNMIKMTAFLETDDTNYAAYCELRLWKLGLAGAGDTLITWVEVISNQDGYNSTLKEWAIDTDSLNLEVGELYEFNIRMLSEGAGTAWALLKNPIIYATGK